MTRVVIGADWAAVAAERRRRYLAAWPLERQMEAHAEAAAGRPALLQAMTAELAAIRAALPYPGAGADGEGA